MAIVNVKSTDTLKSIALQYGITVLREVEKTVTFDPDKFVADWKTVIDNGTGCVLVHKDEFGINGIICGIIQASGWDSKQIMAVEKIWWVMPDCRSTGIGSELIDAFGLWGANKGANLLIMVSLAEFPLVEQYYKKCGFKLMEKTFYRKIGK